MKKSALMLLSLTIALAVIIFSSCDINKSPETGYKTPSDFHNMTAYTVTVDDVTYKVVSGDDGLTCMCDKEIYIWKDGVCTKYILPDNSVAPNPNGSKSGGNSSSEHTEEDIKNGVSDAAGDGGNVIIGSYVEGTIIEIMDKEESATALSEFLKISGAAFTALKGDDYIMMDYTGKYMAEPKKFLEAAYKKIYTAKNGSEEGFEEFIKQNASTLIGDKDDFSIMLDCSEKDTIVLTLKDNKEMTASKYKFANINAVNITIPDNKA
ncbi:MAG: hypothetical protein K2I79_00080 [Clostridia bacterium]|nr:hypothetical protein [Clostridia bacterium]